MRVKPGMWAITPGAVDPVFQPLWAGLEILVPFWEGGGPPREYIRTLAPNTVNGSPFWTSIPNGRAVDIDGTEYYSWQNADIPDAPFLTSRGISALWAGVIDTTASRHFVGKHLGSGGSNNPFDFRTDNSRHIEFVRGTSSTHSRWTTTAQYQNGEFLVVGVSAPTDQVDTQPRIFINGVGEDPNHTNTGTGTVTGGDAPLRIGRRDDGGAQMDGKTAMVAVWNRAFSDANMRLLSSDPFGLIRPATLDVPLDPFVFFDVTDVPADFSNAESARITVRVQTINNPTSIKLYAQLFRSDEATPLSDEVECVALSGNTTWTNYSVPFTGLDTAADKTVWDAARIRFRWSE